MAKQKRYLVCMHRDGYTSRKPIYATGTVKELTEYYSYTLECGKSWEHEKGNRKINKEPKSIKSLITNVNNAMNNSAGNGYSGRWLELIREVDEDFILDEDGATL